MTESEINALLRSILALAAARYPEGDVGYMSIVLAPTTSSSPPAANTSEGGTGAANPQPALTPPMLIPMTADFAASIRRGGGKWGNIAGAGPTPLDALKSLHRGLLDAHKGVDGCRSEVKAYAERLTPPAEETFSSAE